MYLFFGKADQYIHNVFTLLIFSSSSIFNSVKTLCIYWSALPKNRYIMYEKDFNSDDNLLLNKMLNLHMLTVIVRSVFQEDNKYYPPVF